MLEKDGKQLIYSCNNKVEPPGDFKFIKEFKEYVDCNNKPVEQYCACIYKKFENSKPLSVEDHSLLTTEIGFFGGAPNSYLQGMVAQMGPSQQLKRLYGLSDNKSCMQIEKGGANQFSYERVQEQTNHMLDIANDMGTTVPAYVNSKYLDEALAVQNAALVGKDANFKNERDHDAEFMLEIAKFYAEKDQKMLLGSKDYAANEYLVRDEEGKIRGGQERADISAGKVLLPWQSELKDFVLSRTDQNGSKFLKSPLFKSLFKTFERFGPNWF